jgi:serine/threonine-protein kinase HipA
MPSTKYQNEGGPSPRTIVELLQAYSSRAEEDVTTFIEALVIAWATVGTDGHAKNYSLLHSAGGKSRLAPLYDVASILPYTESMLRRTKLAMSIGGKYKVNDIGAAQWRRFADDVKVDADVVQRALRRIVPAIPDAVATVRRAAQRDGLDNDVVRKLAAAIEARVRRLPSDF